MNIEYDVCGFERNDKMEENKITAEVKQPEKVIFRMPVLPLRGLVLFPHTAMHLEAQRKFSIKAIEYAVSKNVPVLLLTQIDASVEKVTKNDFYNIGTIANLKKFTRLPNECVRVFVDVVSRAKCIGLFEENGLWFAEVEALKEGEAPKMTKNMEAQIRSMKDLFAEYFHIIGRISPDVIYKTNSISDVSRLTDTIAGNMIIDYDDKEFLLEILDVKKRIKEVIRILTSEIELLKIEIDIQSKVQSKIDKNQREHYLREKMRVIAEELGEDEDAFSISQEYVKKLESLKLDKQTHEKILKEINHFSHLPSYSQEASVIRTYLDTLFDLPWNKKTKEHIDIKKCIEVLDKDHYGMEDVKQKLVEYLSAKQINPQIKSQIICLAGPPGVGKTSVARSVAKALGRKYERMSLGGVRDEAQIRGHRKTYVGAMMGSLMGAVRSSGVKNPLILLDEIDKLGSDYKGDPASALLEALDSQQNYSFTDHYLGVPFDLSDVLFITTANNTDTIPAPLLDRMEVINLSSYTRYEKYRIAHDYLIKKQFLNHKITKKQISIDDSAVYSIIDFYVREAGVRNLERTIINLIRKCEKKYLLSKKPVRVTESNIEEFLGKKKYLTEKRFETPQIGAVMGLAWTQAGGDTLFCEAVCVDGTGKIEATGSLGDVMKESTRIAVTHIRSISGFLGIDSDFYKKNDIFIHFPDGATPKDGPSAGITIALAVASALTKREVRSDVAMTGEISVRGKVLPIGGLKEKAISAHRAGIFNIIIPKENEKDIEDIPYEIRKELNFMCVSEFSQVLEIALLPRDFEENFSPDYFKEDMGEYGINMNYSQKS